MQPNGHTAFEIDSPSPDRTETDAQQVTPANPGRWLIAAAALQLVIYAAIGQLSAAFDYNAGVSGRPIPLILALLWTNFAIHLASLRLALTANNERVVFRIIVLSSLAFRGVMVFSVPIQEVDIYRYCWDGAVLRNGVSPFRYPPERVRTAELGEAGLSTQLRTLIRLRDEDPGLAQVLARVHYAGLTTIYPPVSQAVFAMADVLTPRGASLKTRLLLMKSVIVLFDLAVLALMSRLLALVALPQGWLIAYGWCPLVLKEFANSGHLDSIAVCLCCAALLAFLRGACSGRTMSWSWLFAASGLLALGFGAKLYPIVLLPLLVVVTWVHHGWRCSSMLFVMTAITSTALLSPMLVASWNVPDDRTAQAERPGTQAVPPPPSVTAEKQPALTPPPPSVTDASEATAVPVDLPSPPTLVSGAEDGLTEFLSRWEMNDLIFMVVEENLRPQPAGLEANAQQQREEWFVVTPNSTRRAIVQWFEANFGVAEAKTPFTLARLITLAIFAGCLIWFACRAAVPGNAGAVLEYAFLTLAWFWLLAPTQNPWYWTWALPLVAFSRGKAWLAVSGCVLIYYLRFWCMYEYPEQDIFLSGYPGSRFFDFVMVWFEFAPFLLVLWFAFLVRKLQARRNCQVFQARTMSDK